MELALQNPLLSISHLRESKVPKLQGNRRTLLRTSATLPETVVTVAVAATVVGTAAVLLVKRTKESEKSQTPVRECEDCGGSGICSECEGEGFVLQKLSQERAERARKASNDAATRFTSGRDEWDNYRTEYPENSLPCLGLPRKWSYCSKCSSARSCSTCGGSGKLAL